MSGRIDRFRPGGRSGVPACARRRALIRHYDQARAGRAPGALVMEGPTVEDLAWAVLAVVGQRTADLAPVGLVGAPTAADLVRAGRVRVARVVVGPTMADRVRAGRVVVGPATADPVRVGRVVVGPIVVVLTAEDLEAEATPPAVVLAGGLPVFSALSLESSRRGRTTKPSGLQCAPDFQGDVDAPSRVSIR